MIIDRIRAQNVLKYAELDIELAERGLIAISGQNESGKSSIGETVCFALFGRTFSIPPQQLAKVVRWGENHCHVTLEFRVADQAYVLSRFLDRDGNHSAKLARAEEPDTPLARGLQSVADALFGILGFEYEEFVESFYLAQREITTPHPHSQAVKIMAGVAPLERVSRMLESESAEREELLGEINTEWDAVDADVQALGIRAGQLQRLEEQRDQTESQRRAVEALAGEIDAGVENFAANRAAIQAAESSRGRAAALRLLVLLLALAATGLWALLTQAGELPLAQKARELLAANLPGWGEERVLWIAWLAAGLGALFLLLWIRVAGLRGRIASLRESSRELGPVLVRARSVELEALDDEDQDAQEQVDEDAFIDEPGAPQRPAESEFGALRGAIELDQATERAVRDYGVRESAWLGYVAARLGEQADSLDADIEDEQVRRKEAEDLSAVLDGLARKREEIEQRIEDRRRGLELLAGAIAHLSNNFNRDVKDLVGRMLPLFTDGRYEHLQIDEGLKVRVFSSEKRDFMDLEEVSSGTQRQVMLALRLALSQKLLSRTVKGRQFVFLDEPFAFFDQERTRRALQALAKLDEDISQVWIVAQDFPEKCQVPFDTRIECERTSDTLIVKA
jgi:exonuclease SbcC